MDWHLLHWWASWRDRPTGEFVLPSSSVAPTNGELDNKDILAPQMRGLVRSSVSPVGWSWREDSKRVLPCSRMYFRSVLWRPSNRLEQLRLPDTFWMSVFRSDIANISLPTSVSMYEFHLDPTFSTKNRRDDSRWTGGRVRRSVFSSRETLPACSAIPTWASG